jgi:outer membrane protein assembly factor BamE (lipoprotein component of BamABCDE complex)
MESQVMRRRLMLLLVVVAAAVAAALLSLSHRGNNGDKTSKQRVSEAEFAQVKSGWTKEQLRGLAGTPLLIRSQRFGDVRMECWFYNDLPSRVDHPYQFCFSKGLLARKYMIEHGSAA